MKALHAFLDEVCEEMLGIRWLAVRPHIHAWLKVNPERAIWLDHRLRQYWRRDP